MRLDEILIKERLATKEQINEALEYQKQFGGRIESHLFRFGYIGEQELLTAIKKQFQCKTVNLSDIDIAESVLQMIPAEICWNEVIIPFDYDVNINRIMVACQNPFTDELIATLNAAIPDKNFEFYITIGSTLKSAIIRNYRSLSISIESDSGQSSSDSELTTHGNLTDSATFTGDLATIDSAGGEKTKSNPEARKDNIKKCHVLVLNDSNIDPLVLKHNLYDHGYEVSVAQTQENFLTKIKQSTPDIYILIQTESPNEIIESVSDLIGQGIKIDNVPTFLIVEESANNEVMTLLNYGMEDIISIGNTLEPLIIKLNRVRNRLEEKNRQRISVIQDLGTHGSLEDINVIDLLQGMGPSEKTARLSITGNGSHLTIFLDKGKIIYAKCDGFIGGEAVYQGIPWRKGIWSIDPIAPEELPEPNNFQSNDAILLEGCRHMDERGRTESVGSGSIDNLDDLFQ